MRKGTRWADLPMERTHSEKKKLEPLGVAATTTAYFFPQPKEKFSPQAKPGGGPLTWIEEQRVKKVLSDAELFEFGNENSVEDGFSKAKKQASYLIDKCLSVL